MSRYATTLPSVCSYFPVIFPGASPQTSTPVVALAACHVRLPAGSLEELGLGQSLVAHVECQFILGHMAVRGNQHVYDLHVNVKPVAYPAAMSNFADDDGWTAERDLDKCAKSERRGQGNPNPGAGNFFHLSGHRQ